METVQIPVLRTRGGDDTRLLSSTLDHHVCNRLGKGKGRINRVGFVSGRWGVGIGSGNGMNGVTVDIQQGMEFREGSL